jgi:hypothetical protein
MDLKRPHEIYTLPFHLHVRVSDVRAVIAQWDIPTSTNYVC